MQRVCLDRVDFRAAPTRDEGGDKTKQQSAKGRYYEGPKRVERDAAGQPLARIEAEEKLVHEPDHFAHGGDRKAGDDADDHCQYDDARFTRANYRAQSMRHFERAVEQMHLEQNSSGRAASLA